MQALLDNLAAVVIGATVLLIVAFTQFRGQEAAVDGVQYYAAKSHMVDFARQLQVDLHSLGAGVSNPGIEAGDAVVAYTPGDTTDVLAFRTYGDSTAFATKTATDIVCYQRTATGETAHVWNPATATYDEKPTFQITRRLNPTSATTCTGGTVTGASMSSLTDFRITLRKDGGAPAAYPGEKGLIRQVDVRVRAVSPLGGGQTEHLGGMKQHVDETRWDSVIRPRNLTRRTL